ncbi:hypothetical protein AWB81_07772 [Caballeronia arationis]|uniref:Uncharacterized protein n=1 Tax=Caballeronia arationis TaxID=1777142 RepID=A0A7Z7I1E3_9BURK|nr:hypothetical protein AWB81_07772 [Caballeronia arationis]SOE50261.1 hypothetical protein SAMN05446927_0410 [Caballeronia arationis]
MAARYRPKTKRAVWAWWSSLTELERAAWLAKANTAVPAVAWALYQNTLSPSTPANSDDSKPVVLK